jgi:hypothetical protein
LTTLEDVLKTELGFRVFMEFCEGEFSSENLSFWNAVNLFKHRFGQNIDGQLLEAQKHALMREEHNGVKFLLPPDTVSSELTSAALSIFDNYVCLDSPYQVNLSQANQRLTSESAELLKNGQLNGQQALKMFNEAQTEILQLMQADSFSRFLKSPFHALLKSGIDKDDKETTHTRTVVQVLAQGELIEMATRFSAMQDAKSRDGPKPKAGTRGSKGTRSAKSKYAPASKAATRGSRGSRGAKSNDKPASKAGIGELNGSVVAPLPMGCSLLRV